MWIAKSRHLPATQLRFIDSIPAVVMSVSSLPSIHWLSCMFTALVKLKEQHIAIRLGLLCLARQLKLSQ